MRGILIASAFLFLLGGEAMAAEVEGQDGTAVEVKPEPPRKPAEVRADTLDMLFARLYKSSDDGDAQSIEKKIWSIWMASDSPTAEVLLLQATKAMDDGAPKESLDILNRLIGSYPDFAEAWNKRATLYYLMKRDEDSLRDIDKVLELEPRHFGAIAGKGMILKRQKKYGAALEAFEEALAINPGMEAVKASVKELKKLEQGI